MFKKTIFFIILLLLTPLPLAFALTPTNLTLEKYVGDYYEVGKQVQLSARLLDTESNWVFDRPITFFYKIGSAGNWINFTVSHTDVLGYTTAYFTAGTQGAYFFKAEFLGDSEYNASTSNVVSITFVMPSTTSTSTSPTPTPQFGEWGLIQDGFTATLNSNSSGWQTLKPFKFTTNGKTEYVLANYTYEITPLSVFDYKIKIFSQQNFLTFDYNSFSSYKLVVGNITVIETVNETKNWFGLFGTLDRKITTIFPNGTVLVYETTKSDPLRLVFFRSNGHIIFAWTLLDYPKLNDVSTTLSILHGGKATAWDLGVLETVEINQEINFTGKNLDWQSLEVQIKKIQISTANYEYTLALMPESASEGLEGTGSYFDPVSNTIQTMQRTIPDWIRNIIKSLGLEFIISGIGGLATMLSFAVSVALGVLPFFAILFLILNLSYIVTLNFDGLIEFYVSLFQITANVISAVRSVIDWAIEGVKAIFGTLGNLGKPSSGG